MENLKSAFLATKPVPDLHIRTFSTFKSPCASLHSWIASSPAPTFQQIRYFVTPEHRNAVNSYKSVSVLVIYCKDGDVPGFKEETLGIESLFQKASYCDVDIFAIPTKDSHRKLDMRLNALLDDHGQANELIVIHYGGHGDPDDAAEQEQLSIWAA